MLVGDEARRRFGEPARDADVLDAIAETRLHALDQRRELGRFRLVFLFFRLVVELAEVEPALRDGNEWLLFELGQVADDHSSTRSDISSTSMPLRRNTSRCGLFFAALNDSAVT